MSFLEAGHLSRSFSGLAALRDVSFSLKEGEILGLVGPNGAGKTTLFNLLSGFFEPDSGSIFFQGHSIVGCRPHQVCRRGIARTFQIVKPFLRLSAAENVLVGTLNRPVGIKLSRGTALELLCLVGLDGKRDVLASHLTLAERKRLELARALATEPRLLLLDEIMAGLNPTETIHLIDLVRRINETGVTLVVIEHVMKAVMALSHRVIVLHHGEKIAEGRPEEIVQEHRVVEAYLGEEFLIAKG